MNIIEMMFSDIRVIDDCLYDNRFRSPVSVGMSGTKTDGRSQDVKEVPMR